MSVIMLSIAKWDKKLFISVFLLILLFNPEAKSTKITRKNVKTKVASLLLERTIVTSSYCPGQHCLSYVTSRVMTFIF